ncbi:unnamed protein product [Linum trigynum]|uniref:No apical meristem-associated C-terminal domain-containing protein n=1 Tax=Linum trigynum TaxID=586398 RepID=A0AAV2ENT4_9ROSI
MTDSSSTMPSGESDSHDAHGSPAVLTRPEGRDKQKKNKRGTPYSSNEAWEKNKANLVENSDTHARLALAREERGVAREARDKARDVRDKAREARDKNIHDMKIMNMDLSQFSPRTRGWYQMQKDEILASYGDASGVSTNYSPNDDFHYGPDM